MKKRKALHTDLVMYLSQIVEENTSHYQSDLKYDIEMFDESLATKDEGFNRYFLWLSRESGTQCQYLTDALNEARGSSFLYYHGEDGIIAFLVKAEEKKDGKLIGSVMELEFDSFCTELKSKRYWADQMVVRHRISEKEEEESIIPMDDDWGIAYNELAQKYGRKNLTIAGYLSTGYYSAEKQKKAEAWAYQMVRTAFCA